MPATMRTSIKKNNEGLSPGIAEELKRLIYSGEIEPGERLNEVALAAQMGTSRGPVREAIRVLSGLGLVTAVRNRGFFVRKMTVRDMLENYDLRALIFGYAAECACKHINSEQAKKLKQILDQMDAAQKADNGSEYYELNLQFHTKLLDLSENHRAHQSYDELVKEMHLFRRSFFNSAKNMKKSNEEHRAIFDAVTKKDSKKAKNLAERHVLSGRERLLGKPDKEIF